MKQLHEFPTLIAAQTEPVTGQRMLSPDMMVAYLAKAKLFRAVLVEDSEPAAALRAALQFGSEFNFIEGHPASVLSLLQQMGCSTPEFEANCVNYANPVTYPYKNVTQVEFEAAKLAVNPRTVECTYPSEDYILNRGRTKTNVFVNIPTALDVADTITFTCKSGNTHAVLDAAGDPVLDSAGKEQYSTTYSENTITRASLHIPAGFTGLRDTGISLQSLMTKVKAYGTSKFDRDFTVSIQNTSE